MKPHYRVSHAEPITIGPDAGWTRVRFELLEPIEHGDGLRTVGHCRYYVPPTRYQVGQLWDERLHPIDE